MKEMRTTLARQRGALFIVMATVLVLGFAWFVVAAMGKTGVTKADKDAKTAAALQAGKKALLSYVAQYAARTGAGFEFPGRMPCAESLSAIADPDEDKHGVATGACSNVAVEIGRLPWKTLGIDQLRDADGEPLWYALSPNFHPVTFPLNPAPPNPYLNFGTPAALPYDHDNNPATPPIMVVALILAPGRALKSDPCTAFIQEINRYSVPLEPRKFFECGNATGVPAYINFGNSTTRNDRVLEITKEEWADAIAGPVADRIQREVAAVMGDFRRNVSDASWERRFLPFASTFTAPSANDLCGDSNIYAGMPPSAASSTCDTNWTNGNSPGLPGLLTFGSCTPGATEMLCSFTAVLPGIVRPIFTADAPRIGHTFRSFDPTNVQYERNGSGVWQTPTLRNYNASIDAAGKATIQIEIEFELLAVKEPIRIRIPNPADVLRTNIRSAWFVGNAWDRFTYYAITPAATVNPGGSTCIPTGTITDCLTVTGMPAPANNKRLVLTLMGRPIPPADGTTANPADYMELQNASPTDRVFETQPVTATFNDRIATCPFSYTDAGGTVVTTCN
jgi:hypothetical protein